MHDEALAEERRVLRVAHVTDDGVDLGGGERLDAVGREELTGSVRREDFDIQVEEVAGKRGDPVSVRH